MHNNYFFLRQWVSEAASLLTGTEVLACFTQNKDEIIVGFAHTDKEYYLKAEMAAGIGHLNLLHDWKRARANSMDLYPEIIGRTVLGFDMSLHDRSFCIRLSDEASLIFKMHGNRSNLLVQLPGEHANRLFRSNLHDDRWVRPEHLQKDLDLGYTRFESLEGQLKAFIPTLGQIPLAYAQKQGYDQLSIADRWQWCQRLLQSLESPTYYITRFEDKPHLSLLPIGEIAWECHSALEASTAFGAAFGKWLYHEKEQAEALQLIRKRIRQTELYISKTQEQIDRISQAIPHEEIGHLLMAHLHLAKANQDTIEVEDYYRGGRLAIKVKPELSIQENAARFYRKAKNEAKELEQLHDNLGYRLDQLEKFRAAEAWIMDCTQVSELRRYLKENQWLKKTETLIVPYKEILYQGFKIWIGKNAESNDQMLSRFSHKNDLWLHARSVAGSHVLVKWLPGQPFPKSVIQYAADLAAWHSKARNESLCPVIAIPRKYVRKVKGAPAGMVVLDREEVLMASPRPE